MNWNVIRDTFLFFGGVLGVGHEVLLTHSERPTLLILFAAMMGLPAFLQGGAADNFRKSSSEAQPPPQPPPLPPQEQPRGRMVWVPEEPPAQPEQKK